jgi:uncharacterized membrane protein (DUF2068 family)
MAESAIGMQKMNDATKHGRALWLIAAFKMLKGLALLTLAIGALKLLHKDVAAEAERLIDYLRVDPQGRLAQKLMEKLGLLTDKKLEELGITTFFYSGLLLTEGIGLGFRQSWAEYLTIVTTTSLIPLEVYEIARRVSAPRILLLLINIAVVIYLIHDVKRARQNRNGEKRQEKARDQAAKV